MRNRVRRAFLITSIGGAVVAGALVVFALWSNWVLPLPSALVRVGGRVAGIFTVRGAATVELPVAWHRQEHALSCEIAALRMALGAQGSSVSEGELLRNLPFDPTPRQGGVWGDPNRGFVGNIDGEMLVNGYGVYWDPIARLGLRYRRTEVLRDAEPQDLARHVAAGRPVVIWGFYGRPRTYEWRTPVGDPVTAVNGEHTRVVIGFSGLVGDPTEFVLLDPIFGRLVWSREKLRHNWNALGRHAVVVYAHPRWVRAAGDPRIWEIDAEGRTRRVLPSWDEFIARGGYSEAVVTLDAAAFSRYEEAS